MKSTMEEMLPDRNQPNAKGQSLWDSPHAKELWDQARGGLLGFADHLERCNAGITADQIRMAVAAGDEKRKRMEP